MPSAIFSNDSKFYAVGNSFRIYEWSGGGPDYIHVHDEDDEAWHVLAGTLTFVLPEGKIDVGPGETMFIPAGVPHTFYEAHGPTRYLMILTPQLDQLIAELHQTPYPEHASVMEKYKSKIIGQEI